MDLSKNRVAKYLIGTANANPNDDGGRAMPKMHFQVKTDGRKPASDEKFIAERTATKLQETIDRKWDDKDSALARQAKIDASSLSVLKTKGTHKLTPSFKALCKALAIDPRRLIEDGVVVDIETTSTRPDLHTMLESLIGTPDEPAVERVLKAFVDASRQH